MSNAIEFSYAGCLVRFDPQAGMSLHDLLAEARAVAATLEQAAVSPAPPAEPARPARIGRNVAPSKDAAEAEPVPTQRPKDAAEAEQRFFARYGDTVGGTGWQAVQRYLGQLLPKPRTVEEWIAAAEQVRDRERRAA